MKQSDNPQEFFEKYGFNQTSEMKCPDSGDKMKFEGLEARYVGRLEREIQELRKYVDEQNRRIERLMHQEFYKWKGAQDEKRAESAKP